jgi:uncharacterized protein YcbX
MVRMAARTRLAPSRVTLSGLYVYPIKSCAGISLRSADLSATGLRHDRRWMLIDEAGEFMSQRAHPRMALISVRFAPEGMILSAPDMDELEIPLCPQAESLIDVRIWADTNRGALVPRRPTAGLRSSLNSPAGLSTSLTTNPGWLTQNMRRVGIRSASPTGSRFF